MLDPPVGADMGGSLLLSGGISPDTYKAHFHLANPGRRRQFLGVDELLDAIDVLMLGREYRILLKRVHRIRSGSDVD